MMGYVTSLIPIFFAVDREVEFEITNASAYREVIPLRLSATQAPTPQRG